VRVTEGADEGEGEYTLESTQQMLPWVVSMNGLTST
jgi:hypothetical protein